MSATSAAADTPKDDAGPPEAIDLSGAWLDRDIGWLEFNGRVLHEALDHRTPLLERVKFLAIFSSNLDEFFMKRIALIRPMPGDGSLVAQERREQLDGQAGDDPVDAAARSAVLLGRRATRARRSRSISSTGMT